MAKLPHLDVVHQPSTCSPDLDVVFVHGICGDPIKTWINQETGKMWPREFLPQVRPATRVLSYGYNADIDNTKSHCGIREHARTLIVRLLARRTSDPQRALILVGHCLGGLIIKQALNLASNERNKYGAIMTATCGVFFFGTPHLGSDEQQLAAVVRYFTAEPAEESPSPPRRPWPLGLLRRGATPPPAITSVLFKSIDNRANDTGYISENFVNLTEWYYIVNWTEQQNLPGTNVQFVTRESATLFAGVENLAADGADHFNISHLDFGGVDGGTFGEFMTQIDKALERGYKGPRCAATGDIQGVKHRTREPVAHRASHSSGGMHPEMQRTTADSNTQPNIGRRIRR